MAWFESKTDWYRYWDGPEMIAFRRRNSGRFQVPITYIWLDEIASGALGPEVGLAPEPAPAPNPNRHRAQSGGSSGIPGGRNQSGSDRRGWRRFLPSTSRKAVRLN